jgi:hypothetical protein
MIMMMENAALNAIRSFLESGEIAVGIAVNVRHVAATPAGHRVTAEAESRAGSVTADFVPVLCASVRRIRRRSSFRRSNCDVMSGGPLLIGQA